MVVSKTVPRIAIYGVGRYGQHLVRLAAEKGWHIVAAYNRAGAKIGQDVGRLAGLGRDLGVVVQDCDRACVLGSGSLSDAQAHTEADGSRRYVISARDPGIANWLDAGGLHQGGMFIRWQACAGMQAGLADAVRETRLVKLDELDALLPPGTPMATPQKRKRLLRQRARNHAVRYLA